MGRVTDAALREWDCGCRAEGCTACAVVRELLAFRKAARKLDRKLRRHGVDACMPEMLTLLQVLTEGR
jgi:hypothetical protein